jgi:ABC-type multidrug transport system fused ATPase/permease subunit
MKAKWPYLISFLKDHKLLVAGTFCASLFSNLLTVLIPISIGKYYNLVFHFESTKSGILDIFPASFWDTIPHFIAFFLTLVLCKIVAAYFEKYWNGILGEKLSFRIRNELFEHQLKMAMHEYDEKGIGKYLLRYSGDLRGVQNYLSKGILQFASDLVLLIISAVFLLMIDFNLFAILILFLMPTLLIVSKVNQRLYVLSERHRAAKSGLISFVNTRLRSILTIRIFNLQHSELKSYQKRSATVRRRGIRYQFLFAFVQSTVPSLLYIMISVILIYVAFQSQRGSANLNAGSLLTALLLMLTIMPVLRRTLRVTVKWKLGNLSMTKLMATFNKPIEKGENQPDFILAEGKIRIEDLVFDYNADNTIFTGLNLEIPARQMTWIQGGNGSGKTTLLKLLTRIYAPEKGRILIDDQDLTEVNPNSLRQHIAVVSSEIPIFGRTVYEAVSHSAPGSTKKAVQRLLDQIQAHLPLHMRLSADDPIGDLGAILSKGQIKMLAYIRAFTVNSNILLIDAPFAGLDQRTSEIIARQLRKIKHKTTIVLLSKNHPSGLGDLANILFVDNILKLKWVGETKLEETFVESQAIHTGQTLQVINASVTDSKDRLVFEHLNVEFPGGKISVLVAPNRKERAFIRRVLTGKARLEAGKFFLGTKDLELEDDNFCREMVAFASPNLPLSGETVLDAVCKTKDQLSRNEAEHMILVMQNNFSDNDRLLPDDDFPEESLEDFQTIILGTAKAIVSQKPVLILEQPFAHFDEDTALTLARLLRHMRGSRTVVIISKINPLTIPDLGIVLDPDYVVNFDELIAKPVPAGVTG